MTRRAARPRSPGPQEFSQGPPRTRPVRDELDLTLLVACYNEEGNILNTLDTLLSALVEFPALTWAVLVVYDASPAR